MVQRYAILLLCLILFMMLSLNSQAQVQPSAETNSISVNLTRQFLKTQKDLRDKLVRYTRQFKKNPDLKIPTLLLLVAILYGTIHALGPGHGKLILGAYLLTEDRIRLRKSIFVSVFIAFAETTSAVLLVSGLFYLGRRFILKTANQFSLWIEAGAYALVVCVGGWLAWRHIRKLLHRCDDHHCHHHHHPTGNIYSALVMGLIPCPGVIILMVFSHMFKVPWLGVLMAGGTAIGMSITLITVALIVIFMKKQTDKLSHSKRVNLSLLESLIPLFGATVMIVFGSIFFFGRLSTII